jgi:predicted DNA-binding transcriptional regulator YafY
MKIEDIGPVIASKQGLDPELFPDEQLFAWLIQPRFPVLASGCPVATQFIEAMLTGQPVRFIYTGGSDPGAMRTVSVSLVFQHEQEGPIYVAGFCHERAANRVYALDQIISGLCWN